jgi:tRNA 2-thiouridine synthesizing protein A
MPVELKANKVVDLKGLPCPMPVVRISQEIMTVDVGQVVEAITTDPGSLADFPAWAMSTGQEILQIDQDAREIRFYVKRVR